MSIYSQMALYDFNRKMYPMRSQIWSFFQKLGAAAVTTNRLTRHGGANQQSKSSQSVISALNPLSYFSRSISLRPRHELDPDSMLLRYSFLTASVITVAIFIIKLFKR